MKFKVIIVTQALLFNVVFGSTTICKSSKDIRKIDLQHSDPTKSLPVILVYSKNGVEKKICESNNTEGVCDPKAKDLIAKLEGAGFKCEDEKKEVAE